MSATPTEYNIDTRHAGIRIASILLFFGGPIFSFTFIVPLLADLFPLSAIMEIIIALGSAALLGIGGSALADQWLQKVWPSGRWISTDSAKINLRQKSGEVMINWSERINVLAWYFIIKRGRSWVPKGWYCLACQLLQDEETITFYTFMKPESAQALPQWSAFEQLLSRKVAPPRGEEYKLAKIGEQGRLRAAEDERWNAGAEMKSEDFIKLVNEMGLRIEEWPPEA